MKKLFLLIMALGLVIIYGILRLVNFAYGELIMVVGYGIIAVPTGIVSVELAQASRDLEEQKRAEAAAAGDEKLVPLAPVTRSHSTGSAWSLSC